MDELPDIKINPVVEEDGVLCLRVEHAIISLRLGAEPVRAFVPGWRPTFAYTGFAPFFILQFTNEIGEIACWILHGKGTRLGGSLGELDPVAREALHTAAAPVVRRLVTTVLEQPKLTLDAQSRAFFMLPEDLRRDIAQLCAAAALPQPNRVRLDTSLESWNHTWSLSRTHVEALFTMPFQDRLLATAQNGVLSWPSPIDGTPLIVQGSLCSDDFRFAYRLADLVHGLVCYLIVSHQHAATLCLYIPALNLVILPNSWATGWYDIYVPDLSGWLVPLVCRFGALLEGYFHKGVRGIASLMRGSSATHIGHQLWNELTGIEHFLRLAEGAYIPKWIVPGTRTELWGPIDELFPQLQGRVDRSAANSDFAISSSYRTGTCLVRITGEYVSAELRASVRRSVEATPVYREVADIVTSRARPSSPIILLGLRVENRTVTDLPAFCEKLLLFVADEFPGATIVVDGHNSGTDGRCITSHGELIASRSPLEVERQIAGHLQRLQVGLDVTVVDTLGAPVRTSLAWCQHADCFLSIWGASLAKYRWICNKPGLVITSRWNLQHRGDLHIYDSPETMEMPTALTFVDADAVEDLSHVPLLVNVGPGQPSFFNFEVDTKQTFLQLRQLVQSTMLRT